MKIEDLQKLQAWLSVAAALLFLLIVLKKGHP